MMQPTEQFKSAARLLVCAGLLCAAAAVLPAQKTVSFTFEYEGSPAEGRVQVYLGAPDEDGRLKLFFSNLNFSPSALNESLKLLVNRKDFTLTNATFDNSFNKSVIVPKSESSVVIFPGDAGGTVTVQLNLSQYRTSDGQAHNLSGAAPFSAEFLVETPKAADKSEAEHNEKSHRTEPIKTVEQPSRQPDPETAAFTTAMALTQRDARADALKKFTGDYPGSGRVREALKYIPIEKDPNDLADGFKQYKFSYALEPRLLKFDSSTIQIRKNLQKEGLFHVLELRTTSPLHDTLVIYDEGKQEGFRYDTIFLQGDARFLSVRGVQQSNGRYMLYLTGGEPPFILDFYFNNQRLPDLTQPISTTNDSVALQIGKIRDKWAGHGELLLRVKQRKTNEVESVETPLVVTRPLHPLLYVLAGLAVVLLLVLISRARRQARIRSVEARLKKQQETQPEFVFTEPAESAAMNDAPEPNPIGSVGGIVKIRGVTPKQPADKKALSEADFEALLNRGVYHGLQPGQQWLDSIIAEICLSKKAVQDLDNFLHGQREQHLDEPEGSIPEIGGFLMGKFCFSEKKQRYRVALEEFVPIVPEENTVYQLQFSTESLVRELGDMQDKYPELAVVGWFHTHPGHGLFLSKPDLTIHDGFFRESYQFAMEIDTMTENLDTGFFTRTVAGTVNNQDSLLPESRWFEWKEIEKITRRK